jgi:alpha-tubulin suppressor-like RCC1 family protein
VQASGGTVLGYGNNQFGQVGNGTFSETGCHCLPTPTLVGGLSGVTKVAAAQIHTLALVADGSVSSGSSRRRASGSASPNSGECDFGGV